MEFKRFWWKRISTLVIFTLLITTLVVTPVLAAGTIPIFRLKWDSSETSLVTYPELAPVAKLDGPAAVEATATHIYVTDTLRGRVQIFTSDGVYVSSIGPTMTGPTPNYLIGPKGITVDLNGNIYVADTGNHRVLKFDSNRNFLASIGSYGSTYTKTPPVVNFYNPGGLAVDSTGTFLYVADTGNNRVLKLNAADLSPAGETPLGSGLVQPRDVAVNIDNAFVFVTDTGNNKLVKVPVNGGTQTVSTLNFTQPTGMAIDTAGNLYVVNTILTGSIISKLSNAMGTDRAWGAKGTGDGQLSFPEGIAALGNDMVYVADTGNDRMQYFEPNLPPTDLGLSSMTIMEGNTAGQIIGTFSAIDPNLMDTLKYEFAPSAPGATTCDNTNHFNLSGANLTAKYVYDYETRHDFTICVRVVDANNQNALTKAFPISVQDGSDDPVITNVNKTFSLAEYSGRSGNLTKPGVIITTVNAKDNDVGDAFSYSIVGGTFADAFEIVIRDITPPIDTSAADLKIKNSEAYKTLLNYEATPTHSGTVTVRVEDDLPGDPDRTADITFTINLTDQADPPDVHLPGEPFIVDELAPVNTVVGPQGVDCSPDPTPVGCLISLTDPDAGNNITTLTLGLDPAKPSDYFKVEKVTSTTASLWKVVTMAPMPDHNESPVINFYLQAKDSGNNTTWYTLPITNTNSNNTPELLDDYSMHEDRPVGFVLELATDLDPEDTLTYQLLEGNVGNTFEVVDGKIRVANDALIDFEYWQAQPIPYFNLHVTVQDNGEPPSGVVDGWVRVHITEGNRPPVFVANPVLTTPESTLQSPLSASVVGHISVTDLDYNELVISSDPNGPFVVSKTCYAPCDANVFVNPNNLGPINFETAAQNKVDLMVTVSDGTAAPVTQTFQVTLTNVNEPIQITNVSTTINDVHDRWEPGKVIGQITWSDEDGNQNTQPTFEMTYGENQFGINANTGEIYILPTADLHYYRQKSYQPLIAIRDLPAGFTDSKQFTINLYDDNDPPAFENFVYATAPENNLAENQPNGTVVGSFIVFDENGQDFDVMIDGGDGAFSIEVAPADPPTQNVEGIVIIRKQVTVRIADTSKIDYDTATNHQALLPIKGTEQGTGPLNRSNTYQIALKNVNEPPVLNDQPMYTYQLAEGGLVIGKIAASDPDAGNTLIYEFVSGSTASERFELLAGSGEIRVRSGRSFMITPGTYPMVVRVRDNAQPALYSQNATITITVTPKADPAVKSITVPAAELLVGSKMYYTVTVSNEETGVSSPYALQVKLPAGVGFEIPGSTTGCAMKTIDTVECPGAALEPKGAAGATKVFTLNAYLFSGARSNIVLTTTASLVLGDIRNDLNTANNTKPVTFTGRKSLILTQQDFENGAAPQDFTKDGLAFTDKTTAPNAQTFAGLFNNNRLTYTKNNMLGHSMIEVSFDLYLPFSWDGSRTPMGPDRWKFCVGDCLQPEDFILDTTFSNEDERDIEDGSPLYPQAFPNFYDPAGTNLFNPMTGAASVGSLGYKKDSVYIFKYKIPHNEADLFLNFIGAGLQTGAEEEKWGIDNFKVVIFGENSYQSFVPAIMK